MTRKCATRARRPTRFAFRRDQLPNPLAYFRTEGIELRGAGAWRSATCPFHSDSHPSLRIRVETGSFRCMACGAHGGDVLAFHMRLHDMDFISAAVALRAWEVDQ